MYKRVTSSPQKRQGEGEEETETETDRQTEMERQTVTERQTERQIKKRQKEIVLMYKPPYTITHWRKDWHLNQPLDIADLLGL